MTPVWLVCLFQAGRDDPRGVGLYLFPQCPDAPHSHPTRQAGQDEAGVPVLVPGGPTGVRQGPGTQPPHILHLQPRGHMAGRQVYCLIYLPGVTMCRPQVALCTTCLIEIMGFITLFN